MPVPAPTREEVDRIDALYPLLARLGERWAASRPFAGRVLSWNCHLTTLTAVSARALVRGGGRWVVSACNPATTDPGVVALMRDLGMVVYTGEDGDRHLQALAHRPEILADTGFDLTAAALDRAPEAARGLRGVVEITQSGVVRLRARPSLPFPVVNINDGLLKPAVENRHGVGEGLWQALSLVTGQHPAGRRAVVVGYGAVGAGVAWYGRAAGASVEVVEGDPIRRLLAHYDGFPTPLREDALRRAQIVVTATGASRVVDASGLQDGTGDVVLANVGHWGDEIDRASLGEAAPAEAVAPYLERFRLPGGRTVWLVARGEPVNIVLNSGSPEPTLLHLALEGLTLEHLLETPLAPGEHVVPRAVEARAAALALEALG